MLKPLSRRTLLKGLGFGGIVQIGLPPLDAMFVPKQTVEPRFVFWFNGNGISEKYWIPQATGRDFEFTPCLNPLAPFRNDIHIVTGLDSPAARLPGPGNSHYPSMSALVSGKPYTGRGAGGISIDQAIARKTGDDYRFRSLQVGVSQESFGEAIQRNLSWADRDRPLPPEMLPHQMFDRLFGVRDRASMDRQKSILDLVQDEAASVKARLGRADQHRMEEYLGAVRDLEKSIASLPPEYKTLVDRPEEGGDLRDWPRIAKLQSDLVVHAFASGQTRVASYMLTKCQGLSRFPWLGHTSQRHHEYTHGQVETPRGARILRDICRWHVEEFAYLLGKLKATPEGEGNMLDNTCLLFVHEHAEANAHKNNNLAVILAGHAGGMQTGLHTRTTGSLGDLYLTMAEEIVRAPIGGFPTSGGKMTGLV